MADPVSMNEIDLTPPAGRTYFNLDREWREEFIYFLLIDRFQDDAVRSVVTGAGRSAGIATPNTFYGGTIKGVTRHLDYIAGLGCTTIWLTPVSKTTRVPITATTSTITWLSTRISGRSKTSSI
jgi:alpha-amylase